MVQTTYTYELHGDASYTSLVSSKTALGTLTSGAITSLTPNTTYYARVRSSDHSGSVNAFVSASSATIAEDPTTPTFSAVATTALTINWTDNGNPMGRTTYTYELHGNAAYTSLVSSANILGLTSGAIASLTPNTTYYARLRSNNHAGSANAFVAASTATRAADPAAILFRNGF